MKGSNAKRYVQTSLDGDGESAAGGPLLAAMSKRSSKSKLNNSQIRSSAPFELAGSIISTIEKNNDPGRSSSKLKVKSAT